MKHIDNFFRWLDHWMMHVATPFEKWCVILLMSIFFTTWLWLAALGALDLMTPGGIFKNKKPKKQ